MDHTIYCKSTCFIQRQ